MPHSGIFASACRKRSSTGDLFLVKEAKMWYNKYGDKRAYEQYRKQKSSRVCEFGTDGSQGSSAEADRRSNRLS